MVKSAQPGPPDPGPATAQCRDAMRAAVQSRLSSGDERRKCGPPTIADHTLLQPIGRGAYGEVWLARSALGTLRAVKIVYRARFDDDRPYEREFSGILKYEPISRSHEGLIQVLHVGRNDEAGCFYYVMELADDLNPEEQARSDPKVRNYTPRTLRTELGRGQRLPALEAAQLVLRLAGGLAYLHSRGLIHRDIKPSNVIYVNGHPKLADIGLITDVGSSRTFVGTEGFIPPEGPGTPQADIYALGKLLYELATGLDRMEFPQLPPRPALAGPDGEALLELNEVMTRACAPDPKQRYVSATEFQAEINLFLSGRSLRRARNIERHLARLKRVAIGACAVIVLTAIALWFSKREERYAREREHAAQENLRTQAALRQRAEAAELQARQQLYTALLGQARATVRSGELGHRVQALDALRRAAAISNSVELRREAFAALALPDFRFERELPIAPDVTLAEMDPAFERLALCHGNGPVEIRSVPDNKLLRSLPASGSGGCHFAKWSPNGQFLAIKRDNDPAGRSADVEIWNMNRAERVFLIDSYWGLFSFHPRLPHIMAALPDGALVVWNLEDRSEVARFSVPPLLISLKYSPDGSTFAVASDREGRGFINVHDATSGASLFSQSVPRGISIFDWHPSGRWIAAGADDLGVYLIHSQSGESRRLGRHKARIVLTTFSPDGTHLVTGGWEREMICWTLDGMRRAFAVPMESFRLQFRRDGLQCAVLVGETLQLHAFEKPINHREFSEELGPRLNSAAFSADGRWLAASGHARLGLWDLHSGGPGALTPQGAETRPFFSPDTLELFGSRSDHDCFRWRIIPGTADLPPRLERLDFAKPAGFTSLCLASNALVLTGTQGSRLLTLADARGSATLNAQLSTSWSRTHAGVSTVSPDNRWLGIYPTFSPNLYIHALPGLVRVAKLIHPANIGAVRFSPDGDQVAICSSKQIEFWSTSTWQRTRVLPEFRLILYAPDGQTCWLTKDFLNAGWYDARTFKLLLPLPTGTLPLALSPDGRQLAVAVDAQRLQVWDLAEVRQQLQTAGLHWAPR